MHTLIFLIGLINFTQCNDQKQIIFKINSLKPQEIRIFFDKKEYGKLSRDSQGNFIAVIDSSNILYTSTSLGKIKNCRSVYCFQDKNGKCYYEDIELEKEGFIINSYSNFTSDTTGKRDYINANISILIEKINTGK